MRKIVILTGAGISAESGLGTFRDVGGIWSQYDLEEVATPEGFARNPALVHDFYNARRANALAAEPNAAHAALARLERDWQGEVVLVTQNIDDLHERAGHQRVIHMHGELTGALCAQCGAHWTAPLVMRAEDPCPECGEAATRPDIVWFGEMPYDMDLIERHVISADLFAAIGTSGQVFPAAGFVMHANAAGAETVELNLEPSELSGMFDRRFEGPATEVVPGWVEGLLAGGLRQQI
ncbi:NAD-dependent deacylase [Tropicimonas sediminicola]|uniref:NAD-dependent protein deacylase n=1 Tax=Tropicimonas sediminicola TaxID=1031541 RepID=A0A239CPL8_9RHOB|nr:NAD-dependent deacylase [Tropicimonas sediminicola]SNS21708.1 NAD-dependent deacetylase [Tropicimonas sediminicola]